MKTDKPRRTPEQVWKALEELAATDEMDRIIALTDGELDAELRDSGFDPAKVRADGVAFVATLFERRDREAKAEDELGHARARLAQRTARRGTLSREELRTRIEVARNSPRLEHRVMVAFRNRDTAEATVPELEAHLGTVAGIGFLLLAGTLLSELLETIGLPHLSGYLLAGIMPNLSCPAISSNSQESSGSLRLMSPADC